MWECPSRRLYRQVMKAKLKCEDCVLRRSCPRKDAKEVTDSESDTYTTAKINIRKERFR